MTFRRYRTAKGFWGVGFGMSAGMYWYIQLGPWTFTNEP